MSRWFWVINYIQIFDGQLVMKYRKDRFKVDAIQREWVLMLMLVSLLDSSRPGLVPYFRLQAWTSGSVSENFSDSPVKNPTKQFINDLNKVFPEKKTFLGRDLENPNIKRIQSLLLNTLKLHSLEFKTWVFESFKNEVLSKSLLK